MHLQAAVSNLFREFLYDNDFVEIHSPKLIGGASEGGANVFQLEYFGTPACMAQSP
jgi:aspartyl/asparaginyl-tRNA synthetase